MSHTLTIEKIPSTDPRLGRNVNHDSRSRAFPYRAKATTLKSVRHARFAPPFDQGNLGSCTGNAAVGACVTEPLYAPIIMTFPKLVLNEAEAVKIYSIATGLDPYDGTYPPDDTGSDGLSVAKACKKEGLIAGYQWAFDLNTALLALQTYPVITGVSWYNDMFEPDADGRMHLSGGVAGGHEIVVDEIDVENKRVWITNSWGQNWGLNGRAYWTWDDWAALLKDQGDVTVLLPLTAPEPQPEPPIPPVVDTADVTFAAALHTWLNHSPWFYKTVQKAARTWLTNKGL